MTPWSDADRGFMEAALRAAGDASAVGEVPVGAVVVMSGDVIGTGFNRTITDTDPSAHAEIVALREAALAAENYRLPGATLYATLEPCAMCMGACLQARIARVVFAAYDERAGAAGSIIDLSHRRELNHRIEVNGGLLADESSALLNSFFEERR